MWMGVNNSFINRFHVMTFSCQEIYCTIEISFQGAVLALVWAFRFFSNAHKVPLTFLIIQL